jgi:hypothetical protein
LAGTDHRGRRDSRETGHKSNVPTAAGRPEAKIISRPSRLTVGVRSASELFTSFTGVEGPAQPPGTAPAEMSRPQEPPGRLLAQDSCRLISGGGRQPPVSRKLGPASVAVLLIAVPRSTGICPPEPSIAVLLPVRRAGRAVVPTRIAVFQRGFKRQDTTQGGRHAVSCFAVPLGPIAARE